jgi:hypothetical protein
MVLKLGWLLGVGLLMVLALSGGITPAAGGEPARIRVHLSIDDMPVMIERGNTMWPVEDYTALNQQLLSELGRRSVKASVFVVCDRLQDGDGMVAAWHDGGHAVGNHTYSHAPLNRMDAAAWLADVERCHRQLTSLLAGAPSWFRFPYLGHGRNAAAQASARSGLEALGYKNVPVTVATSDWVHAYAYRRALEQHDLELKADVVADWHRHMDEALKFARDMALVVPGREVPQVVLVHVNELVANEIGTVIDRWTRRGVKFIDLETAMADPVFSMKSYYTGAGGISWLSRIQPDRDPLKYWFGLEEGRLVERFGGAPKPVK